MLSSEFPLFITARRSEERDFCFARILVGGGRLSPETDLDLGPIVLLPLRVMDGRSKLLEADWLRDPPSPTDVRFLVGDRPRPLVPLAPECCDCDK
jgi:hypothetical protein